MSSIKGYSNCALDGLSCISQNIPFSNRNFRWNFGDAYAARSWSSHAEYLVDVSSLLPGREAIIFYPNNRVVLHGWDVEAAFWTAELTTVHVPGHSLHPGFCSKSLCGPSLRTVDLHQQVKIQAIEKEHQNYDVGIHRLR